MVLLRLLLLACVHFIDVIMSLSVVFFLFCFPFFFFFLPFSVCLCLSAVKSHISEARCGRFIFFSLHYWLACTSILHFFSAIQFNSTTAITQNAEHTTTDRLNEWVKECVCVCFCCLSLSVLLFLSSNNFGVMFWDLSDLLVPTSLWVCFNARFQWCVFARFAFSLFVACVYMYHHVFQPLTNNIVSVCVFFLLLLLCLCYTYNTYQTDTSLCMDPAHESLCQS